MGSLSRKLKRRQSKEASRHFRTIVNFPCCPGCASGAIKELKDDGLEVRVHNPQTFSVDAPRGRVDRKLDDCGWEKVGERDKAVYQFLPAPPAGQA